MLPPHVPPYASHAYSSYCIRLTAQAAVPADELVRRMADRNVSCRRGIQPLHHEPYFAEKMQGLVLPHTAAAAVLGWLALRARPRHPAPFVLSRRA